MYRKTSRTLAHNDNMIQISILYYYTKAFVCKFCQSTSDFLNSPGKRTKNKVLNSKEEETRKPADDKQSRKKTLEPTTKSRIVDEVERTRDQEQNPVKTQGEGLPE